MELRKCNVDDSSEKPGAPQRTGDIWIWLWAEAYTPEDQEKGACQQRAVMKEMEGVFRPRAEVRLREGSLPPHTTTTRHRKDSQKMGKCKAELMLFFLLSERNEAYESSQDR